MSGAGELRERIARRTAAACCAAACCAATACCCCIAAIDWGAAAGVGAAGAGLTKWWPHAAALVMTYEFCTPTPAGHGSTRGTLEVGVMPERV